jgi:hypothetical protein
LAAFGLAAFFAFAGFLAAFTSPILKDPDAPVPFDCFKLLFFTPALTAAAATPAKSPKKKTAAKPKKPSAHPKYSEMVGKAISAWRLLV